MDWIWSETADGILSLGLSLDAVGVRNWALSRTQALVAIEELGAEGIAVLGGDIYELSGESFGPNGDGWYCDRDAGEEWQNFVDRSVDRAREYISRYQPGREGDLRFAIVPECP